jgi:hypothetical protein
MCWPKHIEFQRSGEQEAEIPIGCVPTKNSNDWELNKSWSNAVLNLYVIPKGKCTFLAAETGIFEIKDTAESSAQRLVMCREPKSTSAASHRRKKLFHVCRQAKEGKLIKWKAPNGRIFAMFYQVWYKVNREKARRRNVIAEVRPTTKRKDKRKFTWVMSDPPTEPIVIEIPGGIMIPYFYIVPRELECSIMSKDKPRGRGLVAPCRAPGIEFGYKVRADRISEKLNTRCSHSNAKPTGSAAKVVAPSAEQLRTERVRRAVVNRLLGRLGRAPIRSQLLRERGLPSLNRVLAKRAHDSHVSQTVVEMAEMAAEQRRNATELLHEASCERLKQRSLERQGLSKCKATLPVAKMKLAGVPKNAAEALAHEQALITSHRVQLEARKATRFHAKKILKRRETADQKLSERLAARKKVKSSRCLQTCPVFASLDTASVAQIVDVMEYVTANAGETLCREGDVANKMFVIVSGECNVIIGASEVASLKELDVFGESALFPDAVTGANVRSATVRIAAHLAEPARVLVLQKTMLDSLIRSHVLDKTCVRALTAMAQERLRKNQELFQSARVCASRRIGSNWVEYVDPASGHKYYANIVTEEKRWRWPEEVPVPNTVASTKTKFPQPSAVGATAPK